jgi:hypothetical protein
VNATPEAVRLTQKELAYRWHLSVRATRDNVRRFGLRPVDFLGLQPLFDIGDVLAAEARRKAAREKLLGWSQLALSLN